MPEHWQGSINTARQECMMDDIMMMSSCTLAFIIHNIRDFSKRNGNYYGEALLLMCLPSDYLMSSHMTRSPRPSPSVLAYCK